mmetsp:Transcript_64544/g.167806  ORF Transcript_64544/g.167806 Transcript_64544/m.167806 type:complete len:137 (-) Transcript_64544:55-465(-)
MVSAPSSPSAAVAAAAAAHHAATSSEGKMASLDLVRAKLHQDRKRHFIVAAEMQMGSIEALEAKLGEDKKRTTTVAASLRFNEDHLHECVGKSTAPQEERRVRTVHRGLNSPRSDEGNECDLSENIVARIITEAGA